MTQEVVTNQRRSSKRRSFFRKQLVLPAEHGAWSWLLVPFFVGVGVAGRLNTAVLLTLVGGLALFLLRQPATAWLRIWQGRGRRADGPLAAGWTIGLAAIALLCLAGLPATTRAALLSLMAPLVVMLFIYVTVAWRSRASIRTLWLELAGAAGLAGMAPAAMVAATCRLTSEAWIVWSLLATFNVLGALYVRTRIADTHGRPSKRPVLLLSHMAALLVVGVATGFGAVPWPVVIPFAGLLARAAWTTVQARPIPNIKRFGFSEMGVELISGLFIVVGYWMIG